MHNSVPILIFKCYIDPAEVHFLLTCSPHQSPALEALSPLYHSCCRQHKPILFRWHEFATPPRHSRHCPGPPDCGWTHLPHTHTCKNSSQHSTCYLPKQNFMNLKSHIPVRTSHSLTVPSSEDVITNRLLNCRQVTADWCLLGPVETNHTHKRLRILLFLFFCDYSLQVGTISSRK